MRNNDRPLVIKRVQPEAHHGRHGGAWKVAYADFVTAMMAFFLLLWLISSANQETLRGLATYFSDAKVNTGLPVGGTGLLQGRTLLPVSGAGSSSAMIDPITPPAQPAASTVDADGSGAVAMSDGAFEAERERRESASFEEAKETIERALETSSELHQFADNLVIDQTPEGLRIQILDRDGSPMFPLGSDVMYPHTRDLLALVVKAVGGLPNRVSVRGHTDALPFAKGAVYDNWRLSCDRANAARQTMVELGLSAGRIADVTGKGDSDNLIPDQPEDPRNRRLSVVLLHQPAQPRPALIPALAVPDQAPGATTGSTAG